jgi:DNA polymerase III psi subunit
MDFNLQDLKLLYSSPIYWLEPEETQSNENAIIWRNKPQGKVTFVIDEPEIKDKNLTSLLKNIVAAIQIPFDAVNFGVITHPFTLENFQSMATEQAVVFGLEYLPATENPISYQNRTIYKVPKLAQMVNNQAQKKIAWNTLQILKAYLEKK